MHWGPWALFIAHHQNIQIPPILADELDHALLHCLLEPLFKKAQKEIVKWWRKRCQGADNRPGPDSSVR